MRAAGKQITKRLSLNKETLRALADADLERAAGGISFPGSICNYTQRGCVTIHISNCNACTTDTSIFF